MALTFHAVFDTKILKQMLELERERRVLSRRLNGIRLSIVVLTVPLNTSLIGTRHILGGEVELQIDSFLKPSLLVSGSGQTEAQLSLLEAELLGGVESSHNHGGVHHC